MATYTGADKRLKYLFENGGGGGGGTDVEANPQGTPTAYLNTVKIANAIYSVEKPADIYSFEERQVGCWTDAKPIYQKTIDTGALPNNTTKNVNHNISDIDTVVTAFGFAKASGINWIPIPFVNNTAYTDQVALFVNPSTITLRTSGDRSAYGQSYVTIQYTKTTDTAGSGIWTPSGAHAVHYSTEEQIIGTWTDGSTLYEKTQEGGVTFSAINTWYDTNITGVNRVISVNGSITRNGEPIPLGYFTSAINSTWLLRNNTIKLMMSAKQSGEVYALNSITVRYTKTT